jgi:hypothetical protein
MADRLILHVGTPKAGTTYLQTVLWSNRDRLRDAGILVPGGSPLQHNSASTAVRNGWKAPRFAAAWSQLVEEIRWHPGTAVLSSEWFSLSGPRRAREALERLGDAEIHVVVTARDLTSVVPAAWQESLKLGSDTSLSDFIAALETPRERWSYWTLDPAWVARRWASRLDPGHVHIVTVPTSRTDPTLLWERFAGVVGVPEGIVDPDTGAQPNASLGVESARLLQALGPRLREAVDAEADFWSGYRWLRRYLAHTVLAPRGGGRIGLSAVEFKTLRTRSEAAVAELRSRGYAVAGDLAELTAARHDPSARSPEDVPEAEVLERAGDLIADLLRDLRRTSDSGEPVPDNREFD